MLRVSIKIKTIACLATICLPLCMRAQNIPVYEVGRDEAIASFRLAEDVKIYTTDAPIKRAYYTGGYFLVSFSDTMEKDAKWSLFDTKGNLIRDDFDTFWYCPTVSSPGDPDFSPVFDNDRALTIKGEIITPKGEVVASVPENTVGIWPSFNSGILTIVVQDNPSKEEFSCTFIDTQGNIVFPNLKQKVQPGTRMIPLGQLKEGLRSWYDYAKGKWGFVNNDGEVVIPAGFASVHSFRENLAAVKDGESGLWGFIDKQGQYAIKPMFSIEPGDFYSGEAIVTKQNGRKTLISKDGEVFSSDFSSLSHFVEDFCIAEQYQYQGCYLIHNKKGIVRSLRGMDMYNCYESDFKIPFIVADGAIYTSSLNTIVRGRAIVPQNYLGGGFLWAYRGVDALALTNNYSNGIIYDMTGKVIIFFKYNDKNGF